MVLRTTFRIAAGLCCLIVLCAFAAGQASAPTASGNAPAVVIFDLSWDAANPPHYAIAVENNGEALYRSDDPPEKDQASGDPYVLKFTVTEPVRREIFALAAQAELFKGNFDYTKNRVANTGTKTLTYVSGHLPATLDRPVQGQGNQSSFNWSQNPVIQNLTRIFQGISTTVELGRTLDFKRRFDKLALDSELKSAEEIQQRGDLQQVQVIAPVLKSIANDVSVMHIARERAKRILRAAEQPPTERGSQ